MTVKVVTQPPVEPLSLQDAKDHLRIYHDEENDLIEKYIAAARADAETTQGRAYVEQTILYKMDYWPVKRKIYLPVAPVLSVPANGVQYTDHEGTVSTLDAANYTVDIDAEPGMIILNPGQSWPTERLYPYGAISITFNAGYPRIDAINHVDEAVGTGDGTEVTFYLDNTPIVSGSEVIYVDAVVVPAADYSIDYATGEIVFTAAPGVTVAITADYTEAIDYRANIPVQIKQAIMFLTAHFYEYREEVAGTGHIPQRIPNAAMWLLQKDRLFWTKELNE